MLESTSTETCFESPLTVRLFRSLAAIWGIAGITALLGYAVYRLSGHALMAFNHDLTALQWFLVVANIIFMAYSEGFKGFQQNFSPRVAARAYYLSRHANLVNGLLAPLFCLSYFSTSLRRQISVLLMTLMIFVFVWVLGHFSQPWRGIVDAGVVVGLVWGLFSMYYFIWLAFFGAGLDHSPELS